MLLPMSGHTSASGAKTFGSQHHEMTIDYKEFHGVSSESIVWHMEEPVSEFPAVALYYVSKLASTFVKVLLSGEGGDEAFAGHPSYRNFLWLERLKMGLGPLTGVASTTLTTINRLLKFPKLGKYARLLQTPLDSYYYTEHPARGRSLRHRSGAALERFSSISPVQSGPTSLIACYTSIQRRGYRMIS